MTCDLKDAVFLHVACNRGVHAINEDEVNVQGRGAMRMVDCILSLRPHGKNGPRGSITGHFIMFESRPEKTINWDEFKKMGNTAISLQ